MKKTTKLSDYFMYSYSHVDIYLNKQAIQQVESYQDGTVCVKFVGGSSRMLGPFEANEIGYVVDALIH